MKISLKKWTVGTSFFQAVYKRWFRFVNFIPKRIRVVVCTGIVTATLLVSTFFPFGSTWWFFIILLSFVSYATTYIAIFEGIDGVEWYMLFIVPIILTISLYLFYSLLPVRWLTRLPFLLLFALSYYAILLTSNIFNIGVEKSLQLYRAAFSVNFLMQVLIIFLVMQVTLTFKQHFAMNAIAMFLSSSLLSLQLFWTVNPEAQFNRNLLLYSNASGFILLQIAVMLSFIPFKTNVAALIFTAGYYSIAGIMYHRLENTLFKNVIREYSFVIGFVFLVAILTLRW
jgi:hypothetical protein